MSEVKVSLYLGDANVYLNLNVELHSGSIEEDLDDIVRQLFPHLDPINIHAEFKGETE